MTQTNLLEIYRCLCDETRLRILHLLTQGPLCVCHFQSILGAPQVAISKHLAYLREHKLVVVRRHRQWMIYRLPETRPPELDLQLQCLQDCVQSHPVFRADLKRLKKLGCECSWVEEVAPTRTEGSPGTTRPTSTNRRAQALSPREARTGREPERGVSSSPRPSPPFGEERELDTRGRTSKSSGARPKLSHS